MRAPVNARMCEQQSDAPRMPHGCAAPRVLLQRFALQLELVHRPVPAPAQRPVDPAAQALVPEAPDPTWSTFRNFLSGGCFFPAERGHSESFADDLAETVPASQRTQGRQRLRHLH